MTQGLQGQPHSGNHCHKSLMGNLKKKKKSIFQFNAPPYFAQMTLRPRIKPSNHMPAMPALILIPLYHYLLLATIVTDDSAMNNNIKENSTRFLTSLG